MLALIVDWRRCWVAVAWRPGVSIGSNVPGAGIHRTCAALTSVMTTPLHLQVSLPELKLLRGGWQDQSNA